jgi:hypothetical protein
MVAPRQAGGASPLQAATGDPAASGVISHHQDIFVAEIKRQQICSIGRSRRKTKSATPFRQHR